MKNPALIAVPFASNGMKNKINIARENGQDPEDATWSQGFPRITMTAIEDGGLPPKGLDFNGVFYELSDNAAFLAKGGRYKFDANFVEQIGGYNKGAILQSDDGMVEFLCLIDGNKSNPNKNPEGWKVYAGGDTKIEDASTSQAGIVKLNNTLTSDSTTEALTAKQGKALKELVEQKLGKNDTIASAKKLETARKITYNGDATGSLLFDGSKDVECQLTLKASGVKAGKYGSASQFPVLTVNDKGQVTGVDLSDIKSASTTESGIVKLGDTLTSDSATEALTAKQGKILNESKLSLEQALYDMKRSYRHIELNMGSIQTTRVDLPKGFNGEITVKVVAATDGFVDIIGSMVMIGGLGYATGRDKYIPKGELKCTHIGLNIENLFYIGPTVLWDSEKQNGYFYIFKRQTGSITQCFYVDLLSSYKITDVVKFTDVTKTVPTIIDKTNFVDGGFGVNQKWVDLKSQRKFNTIYTNTSGAPIFIAVSAKKGSGSLDVESPAMYVDGEMVWQESWLLSKIIIVPPKSIYELRADKNPTANPIIEQWDEFRREV
ncbi:tail fiber protein [Acinetobacter larvae]|uniref:Uncharacterized protein n=1 Tax=Acinetobacter larvae TaxID=1789224 RepID=A0A1B2LZK2_9GAMM|nr:tail fiber protein [Acinetobacter larvae]AOA58341.1 hypothetical protein BFG52_08220 [Acinetobacter larvae]